MLNTVPEAYKHNLERVDVGFIRSKGGFLTLEHLERHSMVGISPCESSACQTSHTKVFVSGFSGMPRVSLV